MWNNQKTPLDSKPSTSKVKINESFKKFKNKKGLEDLYQLSDGWLELESDPGLFTLLINNFGCYCVEVEEIYDLSAPFTDKVYGFIFLFNVIEERRKRSRGSPKSSNQSCLLSGDFIKDEVFLKEIFFAFQKVPNSCATHAILSVLLNCNELRIGEMLKRLKEYTKEMSPEDKGFAISNIPELAIAHNSHAAPTFGREAVRLSSNAIRSSQRMITVGEAFHFVSFVPINGRLIELDGLKEFPIDHGPIEKDQLWTEKFRQLIRNRLERPDSQEIRYNLMAVIPNKFYCCNIYLQHMQHNRITLLKMLKFFRYYSQNRMISEHNYFDRSNFEKSFDGGGLVSIPNPNTELRIEIDEHSMSLRSVDHNCDYKHSPSSESTLTASDAGSEFNFTEDETMFVDNDVDEHFIVCKFEYDRLAQSSNEENSIPSSSNQSVDNKERNLMDSLLEKFRKFKDFSNLSDSDFEHKLKPLILSDLNKLIEKLSNEIQMYKQVYADEKKKNEKYIIDDSRRTFDYDAFISTFLAMVSEQGLLKPFLEYDNRTFINQSHTTNHHSSANADYGCSTRKSNGQANERPNRKSCKETRATKIENSFHLLLPTALNVDIPNDSDCDSDEFVDDDDDDNDNDNEEDNDEEGDEDYSSDDDDDDDDTSNDDDDSDEDYGPNMDSE